MVVNFNGHKSKPFENLLPVHREEIFKYYNPETKEIIDATVPTSFGSGLPSRIHLSNLTSLSTIHRIKSETKLPGNSADLVVSLYTNSKNKLCTPIVTGIILDDRNNHTPMYMLEREIENFKYDFSTFEKLLKAESGDKPLDWTLLEDVRKKLLAVGDGLVIDVKREANWANVKVTYPATNTIVADRTFIVFNQGGK